MRSSTLSNLPGPKKPVREQCARGSQEAPPHLPDEPHILPRDTQPENDQKLLHSQLRLTLPDQPPPRIRAEAVAAA